MTSNIGSTNILQSLQDSGCITSEVRHKVLDELNHSFRPEFLNRIDETVLFNALSEKIWQVLLRSWFLICKLAS